MNQFDPIWNETLSLIEQSNFLKEDALNWIKNTSLFRIENNMAQISYNSIVVRRILQNYQELIENTLSEVYGSQVHCQFLHANDVEKLIPEEQIQQNAKKLLTSKFNEEYTFESFVEGNSNREAFAACFGCCSETKEHMFNPIMLYGNSGLGKTHLLHAVGNYLKQHRPECNIYYSYTGDLMDLLNDAMKKRTGKIIKEQLIENDFFLIDDIQTLTREGSQEIFFKVYNELINKGSQIIITSDTHPNELSDLPKRLISRFNDGLIINISKPEFETSKAILQKKIEGYEQTCAIQDDVIDYLAQKFSNDVRSLNGSLKKLLASALLYQPEVIDLEFAQNTFMNEPIVNQEDELTIKKIKKAVTRFYGLTYKDIEGKSRQKKLSYARHVFVYLSREMLHKAYVAIGQELGNRDHTTISSSYERACQLLESDKNFSMAVQKVKEML